MWNSNAAGDDKADESSGGDGVLRRYCVAATVNDDLIAAIEGWRRAHGFTDQPEALGELIRLGLMSEVAKIYRLICQDRVAVESNTDAFRKIRRNHRSRRADRKAHHVPAT